jgi:hypothetical protein
MLRFNLWFFSKLGIVHELKLLGVRIIDLMNDDIDSGSCGTVEYPLVTAINFALRNNKTRPVLTETEHSGIVSDSDQNIAN